MADIEKIMAQDKEYYMNTFGVRVPLVFTHGKGVRLFDSNGKEYIDFLAGIATNALGYAHPEFTQAVCQQVGNIIHCSNYFYIEQQAQLAALLCQYTCADKVFFASTGAEANECAIKLARKYFYAKSQSLSRFNAEQTRFEIISTHNSFHGRTIATLAATGQEKYRAPYGPMPSGFINVEYGDISAVQDAITPRTAAILVEPIQGEGGVIEGGREYLQALRTLCDETGIVLIFDEVQTGMGRAGKLFAHQLYEVEPDIFTTAKALGNGIPISAALCKDEFSAFLPGEHGTTFGGNPLSCTAGLSVLQIITRDGFLQTVAQTGAYFKDSLHSLQSKYPDKITDVRGQGLILGTALQAPLEAGKVKLDMIERGFVIGTAGQNTLRFVPPLIIEKNDIDALIQCLDDYFSE